MALSIARGLRRGALALIAIAALGPVAGCGDGEREGGAAGVDEAAIGTVTVPRAQGVPAFKPIEGLAQRVVGSGPEAAVLIWRADRRPPRDAVVFLHAWGWLAQIPAVYGAWLKHLAGRDLSIVFPVYQDVGTPPEEVGDAALAGVEAGLEEIDARAETLVAVGHTTGGAIAFDYAARARELGLPSPRGVLAIYPARNPGSGTVPAADLTAIAPRTRVAVISGPANPVLGGRRQAGDLLVALAHVDPQRRRGFTADVARDSTPWSAAAEARRAFWTPLDRLLDEVRAEAGERAK